MHISVVCPSRIGCRSVWLKGSQMVLDYYLHLSHYVFCLFVHTIHYTQYITQIVQIQTQHAHGHDQRDNTLIFCLLLHSHDIVLYVLKQQMLLDGIVVWSMVQSEGLKTTNKIMIQL